MQWLLITHFFLTQAVPIKMRKVEIIAKCESKLPYFAVKIS